MLGNVPAFKQCTVKERECFLPTIRSAVCTQLLMFTEQQKPLGITQQSKLIMQTVIEMLKRRGECTHAMWNREVQSLTLIQSHSNCVCAKKGGKLGSTWNHGSLAPALSPEVKCLVSTNHWSLTHFNFGKIFKLKIDESFLFLHFSKNISKDKLTVLLYFLRSNI